MLDSSESLTNVQYILKRLEMSLVPVEYMTVIKVIACCFEVSTCHHFHLPGVPPPQLSNSNRTSDQDCHVNDPSDRSELKRLEVLLINSWRTLCKHRRFNLSYSYNEHNFGLTFFNRMFPFMSEIIPAYFKSIRRILSCFGPIAKVHRNWNAMWPTPHWKTRVSCTSGIRRWAVTVVIEKWVRVHL